MPETFYLFLFILFYCILFLMIRLGFRSDAPVGLLKHKIARGAEAKTGHDHTLSFPRRRFHVVASIHGGT